MFDLRRRKGEREHRAVCTVSTSRFGWEVALKISGELPHSRVCRSRDEVLGVSEQWSNALLETGWQPSELS